MSEADMIEILMVDDDEGDTLLAREAMEEAKFANNFSYVHDGLEAIDFLKKTGNYKDTITPDLILLDLNMPRMNGHEFLSWIRNQEEFRLIPVVVLTTSEGDQDILTSYQKMANCFITKPVDLEKFNHVVKFIDEFWTGIVRLPPKHHATG